MDEVHGWSGAWPAILDVVASRGWRGAWRAREGARASGFWAILWARKAELAAAWRVAGQVADAGAPTVNGVREGENRGRRERWR